MSSRRPGIEKKIAELSNAEKHVLRSFEKLIGDGSLIEVKYQGRKFYIRKLPRRRGKLAEGG